MRKDAQRETAREKEGGKNGGSAVERKEKDRKTKKVRMAALFWTSAHVNGFLVRSCSRREFLDNATRRFHFFCTDLSASRSDCDKSTENLLVN